MPIEDAEQRLRTEGLEEDPVVEETMEPLQDEAMEAPKDEPMEEDEEESEQDIKPEPEELVEYRQVEHQQVERPIAIKPEPREPSPLPPAISSHPPPPAPSRPRPILALQPTTSLSSSLPSPAPSPAPPSRQPSAAPRPSTLPLYISNISPLTTPAGLVALLARGGPTEHLEHRIRERAEGGEGYAFVWLASNGRKKIFGLSGALKDGKILRVAEVDSREMLERLDDGVPWSSPPPAAPFPLPARVEPPAPPIFLYIGGLPAEFSGTDLVELLDSIVPRTAVASVDVRSTGSSRSRLSG